MLRINRFSRLNHRLVVLKSGLGLSPDLSPLLLDLDLRAMDLNFDLDLAVFSASPLTSPRRIKLQTDNNDMLDLDLDLKTEDLDLLLYTGLGLEGRGLELGLAPLCWTWT